ncbi:DNA-binding protein [Streptomyces shenzhenensis]|uniref:DNA-binding protein n=1 Tax=Streptomyces shenzhenensis TaxID=943815 RepID=A0A3M0IJA6_9ACTN|nr:DNA-binding protein [Streptomyces shenzhenensis]
MPLRSRSRIATPTSGPGRGPASDGRTRHRRPATRRPPRHRHAPAEELRRRAELLFGEHVEDPGERDRRRASGERQALNECRKSIERQDPGRRRESGHGPPGAPPRAHTAPAEATAVGQAEATAAVTGGAPALRPAWTAAVVASPDPDTAGGEDTLRAEARDGSAAPGWRERAGTALRERMPLWLQARCGLERRGVIALAVLLVVVAVFAVQHFWAGRTQSVRAPQVVRAEAPFAVDEKEEEGGAGEDDEKAGHGGGIGAGGSTGVAAPGTAGAEIVVDVSGKVRKPGIHRLPAGSRVVDALSAAGGVRPGTDTDGLNRARFLVDGEQVVVGDPAGVTGPGAGGASGAGPAGAMAGVGGPAAPVSLNTATVDQLDTLPGVGPVLAQHIVDYRTRHGGFRSVDELRQVKGIGDRRFADLRNLVQP